MRTKLAAILAVVVLVSVYCCAEEAVGPRLQLSSVNLKARIGTGEVQGSGTVFLIPRTGKPQQAWVLTAYHVVAKLRKVETVIDDKGRERKVVRYDDAQVVQERSSDDNSRIVGDQRMDVKVITVDRGADIALLMVRAQDAFRQGGHFYQAATVPTAGTPILHCGAPGGQDLGGSATLTGGIISRTGVRIREYGGSEEGIYDQVDCAGTGGSSGGMVCLAKDGAWVGMITLGLGGTDNFHWMVPVRRVREWAAGVGVQWLLDPKAKPPTEEQISKIPLENAGLDGGDESDEESVSTTQFKRRIIKYPAGQEIENQGSEGQMVRRVLRP